MVRPTLNFSTYRLSAACLHCKYMESAVVTLANELRSIRPFNRCELRIGVDAQNADYLNVSGILAHWYCNRCAYPCEILSCSLGSSVLQFHRIDNDPLSVRIVRLGPNINVIYNMTKAALQHDRCSVVGTSSKVVIKFHRINDISRGPSLTIGKNGGFQWMGNPSELSLNGLHVEGHLFYINVLLLYVVFFRNILVAQMGASGTA